MSQKESRADVAMQRLKTANASRNVGKKKINEFDSSNRSCAPNISCDKNNNSHSAKTRRQERNRLMMFEDIAPQSKLGWLSLLCSISSTILYNEIRLQRRLTSPPLVYYQRTPMTQKISHLLSSNSGGSHSKESFLTRDIKPSLFIGTRGVMASMAAYLLHGISHDQHYSFREIMTMKDGATIAIDWLIPYPKYDSSLDLRISEKQLEACTLYGPIELPIVMILHGINNDTGFGYMKSLMKSVADRGWIACGMNFRGCGGQKLSTPRGYNAAYTGDLRTVIQKIETRLKKNSSGCTPMFLVGNSLGANLITKYLGEEGFSGTLPQCIKGGVSLGNPLHIHSGNVKFPFNVLLGAGVKRTVLQSWKVFQDMSSCLHFGNAIRQVMLSKTIGELDDAFAPYLIRNDTKYPFTARVGYKDGEDYWRDASSNRYIQHVPVPLLILSAQDDFLVVNPALQSLSRCLENPNVLVVKTKCGGHLGWQEASADGYGIGKSWANDATCDFIDAALRVSVDGKVYKAGGNIDVVESLYAAKHLQSKL